MRYIAMDRKIKILVVEDNPSFRSLTVQILGAAGYEVLEASTGKEGLQKTRQELPDLVLLDIMLPDINGLEVCRRIKSDPRLASSFVALISGKKTSSTDQVEGLEGGADAFFTRPIGQRELLARIKALVRLKQTEESLKLSEARFKKLLDENADAILVIDRQGVVRLANPAAETLFHLAFKELVGTELGLPVMGVKKSEVDITNNRSRPVVAEMRVMEIEWENETAYLLSLRDVTDRKQVEEQLRAALKEKEAMLAEIHHRVKNNLQVISSLLNFQAAYAQNEQAIAALHDSQRRLQSMALIHEQLYYTPDLAQIDFTTYVQTLVSDLFAAYQTNTRRVSLKLDVHDVSLTIKDAIPCGLLLNELVSNALKHAFPPDKTNSSDRSAVIEVALIPTAAGTYTLTVADNGVGLPPDFSFPNTRSLGLRLIDLFSRQLKGTVEWQSKNGTTCRITFKPE